MFIPSWDPSGRTRHFICILKTEGDFSSESSAERRDFADTKSNAERQGSGEAGRVPGQRQAGLQRGCWGEGRRGGDTQGGAGHCCTHTRTHVHRHAHGHTHARMLTACTHTLTPVLPHMHSHSRACSPSPALTVTRAPSCCGGRPPSRAARLASPWSAPKSPVLQLQLRKQKPLGYKGILGREALR